MCSMEPIKLSASLGLVITPSHFILSPYSSSPSSGNKLTNREPVVGKLQKKNYVFTLIDNYLERAVSYKESTMINNEWIHHLLLVDSGKTCDSTCAYSVSSTNFEKKAFASFEFALDGIVPISGDGVWAEETTVVVSDLLRDKKLTAKFSERSYPKNKLCLGDVFYEHQSLSNYLVENKYAVIDDERFKNLDFSDHEFRDLLVYINNTQPVTLAEDLASAVEKALSFSSKESKPGPSKVHSSKSGTSKANVSAKALASRSNDRKNTSKGSSCSNQQSKAPEANWMKKNNIVIRKPPDEPHFTYTTSVHDSKLSPYLIKALKRNKKVRLNPFVGNALAAIHRGANVALIGKEGKTFSSIIGVLDQMFRLPKRELKKKIAGGIGPLAIFVCSSSATAEALFREITKYASWVPQLKLCILCIFGGNEPQMRDLLKKGCHILISTPPSLVRLLRQEHWTNVKRLKWLVFDEADALFDQHFLIEEMAILEMQLNSYLQKKIQCIVTSKNFTPLVWRKIQSMERHILLIDCFLEAALFGDVKFFVAHMQAQAKIVLLSEWLKKNANKRTAIVCSTESEVNAVADGLSQNGWKPLVVYNTSNFNYAAARTKWMNMSKALLICSDITINNLSITNATCLVNYSLPNDEKSVYLFRYSMLLSSLSNHYLPKQEVVDLKSLILVDNPTAVQVPSILEFLTRLDKVVDQTLIDAFHLARLYEEYTKKNEELCPYVLNRGECINRYGCMMREHFFPELDAADPRFRGEIVFHPIFFESGNVIYAKIRSTQDANGKEVDVQDMSEEIRLLLKQYFEIKRPILTNPTRGALCVLLENGVYYRAKILAVNDTKPPTVLVRLIDAGKPLDNVQFSQLREMPECVAPYPYQAAKLFIAGLLPVDHDKFYPNKATTIITNLLKKTKPNEQCRCIIRFAFKSALIVDNVRTVIRLPNSLEYIDNEITASRVLISEAMAVPNFRHIPLLTSLCLKNDFPIPALDDKYKFSIKPELQHLTQAKIPHVSISFVMDTHQIFVVHSKLIPQLMELEHLCEQHGEILLKKKYQYAIKEGHICLAKLPHGWNRAKVLKINDNIAQCFMVDHGDLEEVDVTNIVAISDSLVYRLPFQAVECIMGAVNSSDAPEITDRLYELTPEGCFVAGVLLEEPSKVTNGPLYKINLLTNKGKSINQIMISEGFLEEVLGENDLQFLEDVDLEELENASLGSSEDELDIILPE